MSIAKKLIAQTLTYGASSVLGRMLNYLLVPVHTYFFANPSDFGIITELYAYAAFLNIVLTFGMETTFFREGNLEGADKNRIFGKIFSLMFITTVLFISVGVIFSKNIANQLELGLNGGELIRILVMILAFDALSALPFAKLRLNEKPKTFAMLKITNIALNVLLNVAFLALFGSNVVYILWANLIASFITMMVLFYLNKETVWQLDFGYYAKLMPFALPLTIMGLAGMVNEVMDRIFLKIWLPEDFYLNQSNMDAVGIYGACYKLSIFMSLAIQSFRYAAEPFFFKQAREQKTEIYAQVMDWFVIIGGFIFLTVSIWLDVLALMLRNEVYRQGVVVVPVLLMANLFLGIYNNLSIWFKLKGNSMYGLAFTVFGALITLCANYVLIPKMGYLGAAWATLLCYFSMTVINAAFGNFHFPIAYRYFKNISWLVFAIGLFVLQYLIDSQHILYWLSTHFGLPIIYLAAVIFFNKALKEKLLSKFSR